MTENNYEYPKVTVYDESKKRLPNLKKIWYKLKNSEPFLKYRESRFNPEHRNLPFYDTSRENAIALARENGDKTILFRAKNGRKTRTFVELDCPVAEEAEKYGSVFRGGENVINWLPKNTKGQYDLFAEEPLVIAVIPIEGPSLVGHICMQYKDKVLNRRDDRLDTAPLFETYGLEAEYFLLYPSKIGISPKQLENEIIKANVRKGDKKYNILNNNCANHVADILYKCGVKDLNMLGPDKLGLTVATPGNNPFNFGIKNWCKTHGVHARPHEMLQYAHHNFNTAEKNKQEYEEIRNRYRTINALKIQRN